MIIPWPTGRSTAQDGTLHPGICDQRNGSVVTFQAMILSRPCPLWVKSRHDPLKSRCPLYPQKRTSLSVVAMSACAKSRHRTALASHNLFSGRDCPCSDNNRRIIFVRPVHPQHQDELARWGWAPVRLLVGTGRSRYRAQARSLRSAQLPAHLPQRVQGNASARAVEALPWMLSKVF
jgi:hypothetical protein